MEGIIIRKSYIGTVMGQMKPLFPPNHSFDGTYQFMITEIINNYGEMYYKITEMDFIRPNGYKTSLLYRGRYLSFMDRWSLNPDNLVYYVQEFLKSHNISSSVEWREVYWDQDTHNEIKSNPCTRFGNL